MNDFEYIAYEAADGIAKVTLNRPEVRNAQHVPMTKELERAFADAADDHDVKVIILAANGPSFSSGHDLGTPEALEERRAAGIRPGVQDRMNRERRYFIETCRRWRDIPKPTIAQVQGHCLAGGLMLAWVCDLIVASEDAVFGDNTVGLGANGVEYFAHPWEFGPRKAKELLFTGGLMSAPEARAVGMVNQVVPRDELERATLALARRIVQQPSFQLQMAKVAVNETLDAMGFHTAISSAFSIHHLATAHSVETGHNIQREIKKSGKGVRTYLKESGRLASSESDVRDQLEEE